MGERCTGQNLRVQVLSLSLSCGGLDIDTRVYHIT